MNWQEEEIRRRKEHQANSITKTENRNENTVMDCFWGKFISANDLLLPEIKLKPEIKDGDTIGLWYGERYKSPKGYLQYLKGKIYCGNRFYKDRDISIQYDKSIKKLTCILFSNYYSRYEGQIVEYHIDNCSVDIIIKNICTNKPILIGICMTSYKNSRKSAFLNPIVYQKIKKLFLQP